MTLSFRCFFIATALFCPVLAPALAQTDEPTQVPLPVGALQIAAHANLTVEKIDVSLAVDKVVYTYNFKNTGGSDLLLAASLAMPQLHASTDGEETYDLPAMNPENPVGLSVSANGAPIALKADLHAYALGIDRLTEIRAERLPLIPFGPEMDKALASARPDTIDRLAALGLLSPHDPKEPNSPPIADWDLAATYSWTQRFTAGKTTVISVAFQPIKAVYKLDKENMSGLEELKEAVCPSLELVKMLTEKLRPKNANLKLIDIILANNAPVRWFDSPDASVTVSKPTPDTTVIFCGLDPKTSGLRVVSGKMPNNDKMDSFRVLLFGPVIP
jgi:hypothetical protein